MIAKNCQWCWNWVLCTFVFHFRYEFYNSYLCSSFDSPLTGHLEKNVWNKIVFFFRVLQLLFEHLFRILNIREVMSEKLKSDSHSRCQEADRFPRLFDLLYPERHQKSWSMNYGSVTTWMHFFEFLWSRFLWNSMDLSRQKMTWTNVIIFEIWLEEVLRLSLQFLIWKK